MLSQLLDVLFVIIFMLIIAGWVLMLMLVASNIWKEHRFYSDVYRRNKRDNA